MEFNGVVVNTKKVTKIQPTEPKTYAEVKSLFLLFLRDQCDLGGGPDCKKMTAAEIEAEIQRLSYIMDSLDRVEILIRAEAEFKINIPSEEELKFKTIEDAIRYVCKVKNIAIPVVEQGGKKLSLNDKRVSPLQMLKNALIRQK